MCNNVYPGENGYTRNNMLRVGCNHINSVSIPSCYPKIGEVMACSHGILKLCEFFSPVIIAMCSDRSDTHNKKH